MVERNHSKDKLGSGVRDWLIQRGSAIIIASYFIFLTSFLLWNAPLDYTVWRGLFSHLSMQIGSILCLISLAWHSWIGLWIIVTDYIKFPLLRLSVLAFILLIISLTLLGGVSVVLRVQ